MSNVIVFGGSGFLGSHVADKLSSSGHQVTIFDIKDSPYLKSNQKTVIVLCGSNIDAKTWDNLVFN